MSKLKTINRKNLLSRFITTTLLLFAVIMAIQAHDIQKNKSSALSEDVISQTIAIPGQQPSTILGGRSFAMMHLAKFDAVNSIDGRYTPYLSEIPFSASVQSTTNILVQNIEELYSAVNNPQNAGSLIVIAPGVYMLSANGPGGIPRPNGGRLELQENMSLLGVVENRGAVVIDALNLPRNSYSGTVGSVTNTGAIRMGRGSNAVEWLTITNAVNGGAGIIAHLSAPGIANIRIAHVVAHSNARGIDIRNFGSSPIGYVINAEIVDNDLYNNKFIPTGQGLRIVNLGGANGSAVFATLRGNRSYNNVFGLLVENTGSTNSGQITVTSAGDRFFENGAGALIGGGFGTTNGNTVNFEARGSHFENNNGFTTFSKGGLILVGATNTTIPNGSSNNTVNAILWGCRMENNQVMDLGGFGASSNPVSVGSPGINNRVTIERHGIGKKKIVEVFVNSNPDLPGLMNTVTVNQ